ncbi:hypothetical protein FC84_GL000310 [Lapidilactobacillus dextrinicus DSM 20335]|uniref:DUF4365 domain-containing protein n=1 Tax=Lapidilactobacillus dextrinicus DSM 20335 TaxID=1423738 RepID=A0A0R2BGV5_9LACO|nr:DUF4365 domain-containing protein [Lapidilactobacillus dextrinicus]KRM78831.1 hypothetical protein FC84_GL000310 [Lapidilactobacillus dextrinicus DSM 20335]QFG46527.1 DUF4365 domain-containing protein [Lapidilactobacillus dextrinicus]
MLVQKKIEDGAILALQTYFNQMDQVDAGNINSNDKTPAVDGKLDVYDLNNGQQYNKGNLLYSIDLQIKGTTKSITKKNKNKYSVSYADIEFFLKHTNGLIFFVVSIQDNTSKIFYRKLAPLDLKELMRIRTPNQKTKLISFYLIPENPDLFLNILNDFHKQCELQPRYLLDLAVESDTTSGFYTTISSNPKYLMETVKSGTYIYQKMVNQVTGQSITIPYAPAKVKDFFTIGKTSLYAPDGTAIPAVTKKFVEDDTHERIEMLAGNENSIQIVAKIVNNNFNSTEIQIKFTAHGNYEQRMSDAVFLKKFLGYFRETKSNDLKKFQEFSSIIDNQIDNLTEIITLMNNLGILIDFDPDTLNSEEAQNFNNFVAICQDKNSIKSKLQKYILTLKKDRYAFWFYNGEIINYFSPDIFKQFRLYITVGDYKGQVNPYTLIRDRLFEYPTFSFDTILDGFNTVDYKSTDIADFYLGYVDSLITNFDISENKDFLKLANTIFKMISPGVSHSKKLIFRCQICLRKNGEIDLDDLGKLLELTKSENLIHKISAQILLKRPNEVKRIWQNLHSNEQSELLDSAIANLSPIDLRHETVVFHPTNN